MEGFDFVLPRGCVCGLIGPNGAGKTTTIQMVLGLLPADAGSINVLGYDADKNAYEIHQRVGYVPEKHHIFEHLKVRQILKFTAAAYPTWGWAECERVTEILRLPRETRVKALSRGELAKLALTIALAHKPQLLILDEPTSGLDPIIRREFLEAIVNLLHEGDRTVFFSTHILSDVERVAERVIIMDEGRIIADEMLDHLRQRYRKVSFIFDTPPPEGLELPEAIHVERGLREVAATFKQLTESDAEALANRLGAVSYQMLQMNLEDAFFELVQKKEEVKV